jgi:hypothetical protein
LSNLWASLVACSERALEGGDEDSLRFEAFMHDHSPETAAPLLGASERLQRSAHGLRDMLERLAAEVDSLVVPDVLAARALCEACLAIESQNLGANQKLLAPHRNM